MKLLELRKYKAFAALLRSRLTANSRTVAPLKEEDCEVASERSEVDAAVRREASLSRQVKGSFKGKLDRTIAR